jgi:hypothetical protein
VAGLNKRKAAETTKRSGTKRKKGAEKQPLPPTPSPPMLKKKVEGGEGVAERLVEGVTKGVGKGAEWVVKGAEHFSQCTTSSGSGWRCANSSMPGWKFCHYHDAYKNNFKPKSQKGSKGAPAAEVRVVFCVSGWFSDGKPAIAYLFII